MRGWLAPVRFNARIFQGFTHEKSNPFGSIQRRDLRRISNWFISLKSPISPSTVRAPAIGISRPAGARSVSKPKPPINAISIASATCVRSETRPARKKLISAEPTIAAIAAARNSSRGARPATIFGMSGRDRSRTDGFGGRTAAQLGDIDHQCGRVRAVAQLPDHAVDKEMMDVHGGRYNSGDGQERQRQPGKAKRKANKQQHAAGDISRSPSQRLGAHAPPRTLGAIGIDSALQLYDQRYQQILQRMKKR